MDVKELLEVNNELRPQVIVAPDVLGSREGTFDAIQELTRRYHAASWNRGQILTIVQARMTKFGPDLWDWIRAYRELSENFNWVGFPRLLKASRIALVEGLQKAGLWRRDVHYHAFGWTGSLEELSRLHEAGFHSVDSAGPVWRGLLGFRVKDYWPDVKFDPLAKLDRPNYEQAEINLQEVLLACRSVLGSS